MAMTTLIQQGGRVRELRGSEAVKYALARNPKLRLVQGFRVKVPRGTKKVYIPRKAHYAKTVYTEEHDGTRLHALIDILEPCVVQRGAFGFGLHQCRYHPAVYIEEAAV